MFDNAAPSSGEVRALANQLLAWAEQLAAMPAMRGDLSVEDRDDLVLGLALGVREFHRRRARVFPAAEFGQPTWEVMLDLFIQQLNGYRVSFNHLVLEGSLPAEIVATCVETLAALGLVERTPDQLDSRMSWLSLSEVAAHGLTGLLLECAEVIRPHPGAHT